MKNQSQSVAPAILLHLVPAIFVLLWSTGFIGARYTMPYAEPFSFLSWRFVATIALIGGYALLKGARWPTGSALWSALATGVLIHAIYLGAIFWAVKHGFPAGFAGLIVGLQPIVTALFAGLILGDKVSVRQWLGFVIGLVGVALVLGPKLTGGIGIDMALNALVAFGGVAAFSLGTVLQKRFGGNDDLAAGTTVQYLGALLISALIAVWFEPALVVWSVSLVLGFAWLVLVLSVGAIFLLMLMIRAGEVSRVASLFYLVPSVSAVLAYFLFGESLNFVQMLGILITTVGVALATLKTRLPAPTA